MEKDPEKLKRDAEVLRMGYTPDIQSVPTESGEEKTEYILCAAIWYKTEGICNERTKNINEGFVVCGRRHHNIISTVFQLAKIKTTKDYVQGFMTNLNRFVDRYEGRKIAFAAGQTTDNEGQLFSEDLY